MQLFVDFAAHKALDKIAPPYFERFLASAYPKLVVASAGKGKQAKHAKRAAELAELFAQKHPDVASDAAKPKVAAKAKGAAPAKGETTAKGEEGGATSGAAAKAPAVAKTSENPGDPRVAAVAGEARQAAGAYEGSLRVAL